MPRRPERSERGALRLDPRLVIGVVLVAASTTGVWALVNGLDDSIDVYAVRDTTVPGTRITVDDLIRSGELPAIRVGTSGPWRIERTQLEVWIEEQYELTRRHSAWQQGEFANIVELSGARNGRLRPVD